MKTILFKDKPIFYSVEGKGTPVVLLHGFCEDSRIWDDFKTDLIDEGYKVIVIDLPGFGRSGLIHPLGMEDIADCVYQVVSELKIYKLILIGHSMGGYAALAFALKYPSFLTGLGLFHSHPFADSEERKNNRRKSIEFITKQGHQLYVKQLIPGLFSPSFASSHQFLVDKLIFQASRYQAEGIIAALEAMMERPDQTEVLDQDQYPVLFILGEQDPLIPLDEKMMAQTHLPEISSIHVLKHVAHMGMFEAKKETQRIVRQFAEFCILHSSQT